MLAFQRNKEEEVREKNLRTIFKVTNVPEDTQMREVLDNLNPDGLENVFSDYFSNLQKDKILENYRFLDKAYLVSIDGSEYFSSDKICCPCCLTRTSSETKKTRYLHQILQAVLIHPNQKHIIPLAPEQIKNEDGMLKQDCELNAGKRMLSKIRQVHPKLKIIITADGLYPRNSFISELEKNKMSFIIRVKEDGNKEVFSWVEEIRRLDGMNKMQVDKGKGVIWYYEWTNGIPLTAKKDSKIVNYAELKIFNPKAQKKPITFSGQWVTDIEITKENVEDIAAGGRARWKIENECFNTLKNHGYELAHNYGHGQKNLSYNFFLLNLLAFFIHEIFSLTDERYQEMRTYAGTRREFWIRVYQMFLMFDFNNWDQMLDVMIGFKNKTVKAQLIYT
ncbi:MAG: transposase [Bacteroidota bacterium]